jgi:hypothetical protein
VFGKHLPVFGDIGEAKLRARMRRRMRDVAAGEDNSAAARRDDTRKHFHRGALAGAIATEQRECPLLPKRDIEIEQYLARAVKGAYALGAQEVGHAACSSVPR